MNTSPLKTLRRVLLATSVAGAMLVGSACSSPEERLEKYYQSGAKFLEQGDLGRANVQFQNAIKIDETHVPTLIGLAAIAEEREKYDALFGTLQRIVRLDPNNIDALAKLGRLHLINNDDVEALKLAERVLELSPDNIDGMTLKAGVKMRVGDTATAMELANAVVERDPSNEDAATVRVTERVKADDIEGAVDELDRVLGLDSASAVLQLLRIELLANLGREDDIMVAYKDLVDAFPEQALYRRIYAAGLLQRGQLDEAEIQFNEILRLDPDSNDAKMDVVRMANELNGEDAAEARLKEFVAADPDDADLTFQLVDFYSARQKWSTGREVLARLSKSDVDRDRYRALNRISQLHYNERSFEKAREITDQILSEDAGNTDALIMRAQFQLQENNVEDAILGLRQAMNNAPDSAQAMAIMARAFEMDGQQDVARAELAKSFEASNSSSAFATLFADFLIREGNVQRAEEVLEQSLASNPGDLNVLRMLAGARLRLQDWSGVEEIAYVIEQAEAEQESENTSSMASTIRAAAFAGLGQFDKVIDTLKEDAERAPLAARPLTTLTAAYLKQGRKDEAKSTLLDVLQSDPNNYDAHILLAQVYTIEGNAQGLVSSLEDAISVDPKNAVAYQALYRFYLATGARDKAHALIEEGASAAPENDAFKVLTADIHLSKGDYEAAQKIYADILERRPNDKIVVNNYVSLSVELDESLASSPDIQKKFNVIDDKDNGFFQDTIGWTYYLAGDYTKALEYLTVAMDLEGSTAEIAYHLGATQLKMGDEAQGRENLNKALTLGGDAFRYKEAVEKLLN